MIESSSSSRVQRFVVKWAKQWLTAILASSLQSAAAASVVWYSRHVVRLLHTQNCCFCFCSCCYCYCCCTTTTTTSLLLVAHSHRADCLHFISSVRLTIMSLAPFFEKPPSLLNKPDGSVLFECMCNANPPPVCIRKYYIIESNNWRMLYGISKINRWVAIVIYRKWRRWSANTRAHSYSRFELIKVIKTKANSLQNPTLADQGIYKVVATNKNGSHSVEQGYVGACTADQVYK